MSELSFDDELLAALGARGFELWAGVRVVSFGARKIHLIKQVRELNPALGLKDAKEIVEDSLLVLEDVPLATATAAAGQLARAGGGAKLEVAHGHRYAFAPDAPERGRQRCQRLKISPGGLELSHGFIGRWDEAPPRSLVPASGAPDWAARAIETIDEVRRAWAAAGLAEARSELELVVELSARERDLEQRLVESEDEAELRDTAAVYADWLQARGDPRGLVGAAALAEPGSGPDADPNTVESAELAALVDRWAPHLFGGWHAHHGQWRLDWLGPVVRGLELAEIEDGSQAPNAAAQTIVEEVLRLPITAALRRLALDGCYAEHPGLGIYLDASPCAASLRELRVTDAAQVSLRGLRLPRLEQLSLGCARLPRLELHAPRLTTLELRSRWLNGSIDACTAGLDAPALDQLELGLGLGDHWDQFEGPAEPQLARLLAQPSFAKLRVLRLSTSADSVPLGPRLVEALVACPARATLERVDLRDAQLMSSTVTALANARDHLPALALALPPS